MEILLENGTSFKSHNFETKDAFKHRVEKISINKFGKPLNFREVQIEDIEVDFEEVLPPSKSNMGNGITQVRTISLEFPNGDLLLGVTGKDENRMFFIKTSDGIFEYSEAEVSKIYAGVVPADTNMVGLKATQKWLDLKQHKNGWT